MNHFLAIILTLFLNTTAADSTNLDNLKLKRTIIWSANLGMPIGVHAALYNVWYAKSPTTKFRFINDNRNWNQIDKAGHCFSSYFITVNSAASFRYAGYSKVKSASLGATVSVCFQTAIEYFDGHSAGWGASAGDIISNSVGSAFGAIQAGLWGKVKIPMSITFQHSKLSPLRPDILGRNTVETKLKDYNAQTYWISINPHVLGIKNKYVPKWLGISLGYGANGLLGGDDNIWTENGLNYDYSHIQRQRQYYISPSVSLGQIPSRYKLVRFLFKITDHWKLPLPALEFNQPGTMKFYWLYW